MMLFDPFQKKNQDKGITPPRRFKRFFCVLNVGTVVEGKQSGFPLHWIHVDGWTGREDKPTQCPMKLSERNKLLLPEENETRSFCSQRNRYLKIYLPEICSAKRWFHYKTATKRFSVSVGAMKLLVKSHGFLMWLAKKGLSDQWMWNRYQVLQTKITGIIYIVWLHYQI